MQPRSFSVKVNKNEFCLVDGGGYTNYMTGTYYRCNTYLRVFLPQDSKPFRSIAIHDAVLAHTGWKVISDKRRASLEKALPCEFTLHGEIRDGDAWYELDEAEMKVWVANAAAPAAACLVTN